MELNKLKPKPLENPDPPEIKLRPNRGFNKLKLDRAMNKTLLKKSAILTAVVAVVGFVLPLFGLEVPVDSLVESSDGLQVQELVNLAVGLLLAVLAKFGIDYQNKKKEPANTEG